MYCHALYDILLYNQEQIITTINKYVANIPNAKNIDENLGIK
jgi:hypothetical protein